MTNNRSTGPRSAEGKARSSMNALKTGIYAQSLVIAGEDPERLTTLTNEYYDRFRPSAPEQRDQVDVLIRATWELRRLAASEAQVWTNEMARQYTPSKTAPLGQAFRGCDHTLTRLHRIVSATQRSYRDALHELERLQTLDPALEPNQPADYTYEPPPQPAPEPEPAPQPEETKPVVETEEKLTERTGETPKIRGYHLRRDCHYDPIDPTLYKYCPMCAQNAGQELR